MDSIAEDEASKSEYISCSTLVLGSLFLVLLIRLLKNTKALNLPPGPKGWPVVGNLLSLDFHSERIMSKWNGEFGPVCRVKMASVDMVLLGSVAVIQEAFVKKSETFSDRMKETVGPFIGDHGIIFVNYTNKLKEQRRFGIRALREFGMGRRLIEPGILEAISDLCKKISSKSEEGKPFNIEPILYESISSVISKIVFNKDLPAENKEFKKLLDELIAPSKYSVYGGIIAFFPALKVIPPFRYFRQLSVTYGKTMERLISEQVEEHVNTRDAKMPRDLIDCFLNEMDTVERGHENSIKIDTSFVKEQLVSLVRDLFLAGSDTTSTTLHWLLLFVSLDNRVQHRIQAEIDSVLGEGIQPSMAKSECMPYTRAVIEETQRMRPVAPIGIPHVARHDDTIFGYDVPKGSLVVSNIFHVQNDENIWTDPERFNPDRHLDKDGKFVKSPHVLPFSLGARQCLGQQLAVMELFLVVSSLFRRFRFEIVDEDDIDICGWNMFTLRPNHYKMLAFCR